MKKIYIILLLAIPFVFQACLKEQEDIFDESPAERMEQALIAYKELLTSSNNGWLLESYPERNQSYGGYVFILKFTPSSVEAFSELSSDVSESSGETLFILSPDDGPTLSFDTYNSYLHFFSTPSSSMYQGYQGDAGYVLMGVSDDKNEIKIRGKKTGNDMRLRRMSTDPVTYLENLPEIEAKLDAPKYTLQMDGKLVNITISDRIFKYQYEGEEETVESGEIAYCITDKGFRLYKPFEVGNVSVSEFILDGDRVVSVDGTIVVTPIYPPVNELFAGGSSRFALFSTTNMDVSPVVEGWLTGAYSTNLNVEGEYLLLVAFDLPRTIIFYSAPYYARYYYGVAPVAGTENKVKFDKEYTMDANGEWYNYNFGVLVQKILDEEVYILEPDNIKNPTSIKFISERDSSIWFVVNR
jgi:hypothetical protein